MDKIIIQNVEKHEGLKVKQNRWVYNSRPNDKIGFLLFRDDSIPHAGIGMGIDSVIAWICKLPHIRETILYPRMIQTLRP